MNAEPRDDKAAGSAGQAPEHRGDAGQDDAEHDPTGLELARQVSRSVRSRGVSARPRRKRPRQIDPQRSGARADDRDPQLVSDAMGRLIDNLGWGRELNVHMVMGRWSELVGSAIADHATPESYRDGVLVVRAESTTWASALRLEAPRVVAILNADLGQGTITSIEVRGPSAPSWKHGRRSVQGRGPRDTYG